ncbi:MAG: hypothetical protein IJQ20_02040 [Paludibacteraceae bacterium]|nr:hypothetical protein [Paludibacteraceae bacterium]MBQ6983687.1 hypothetical protein [Paludibacteraceae bacterium]
MRKLYLLALAGLMVLGAMMQVQAKVIDLAELTGDYEIQDGDTLTGKLADGVEIAAYVPVTVYLRAVDINDDESLNAFTDNAGLTFYDDATVILIGNNLVRGFEYGMPGVFIQAGKTLVIDDGVEHNGLLSANGQNGGAGIGAMASHDCGNIVIRGGTVYALGGIGAVGIGGGR